MNRRMDRSKLLIGVFHVGSEAHDAEHIKDLAECGINFIIDAHDIKSAQMYHKKESLDLLHQYGIGLIADGVVPFWMGNSGEFAGQMSKMFPLECYEKAAKEFIDHPAVWGVDCGDEPSARDFPHYHNVISYVDRNFKNQLPFMCLYPNYAVAVENLESQRFSQLGAPDYKTYIDEYCKHVGTDYIAYDHYIYSSRNPMRYYDNQAVVSEACRKTGRSFWMLLQVNSSPRFRDEYLSANRLRFQAFSTLAYGAECIIWACYSEGGWWHNNVLDAAGEKTEQYDKLKAVNAELQRLAPDYMKYRGVSTHYVGEWSDQLSPDMQGEICSSLSTGAFTDLHEQSGKKLLVGQMESRTRDGSSALLVMAADDWSDEAPSTSIVHFYAHNKQLCLVGSDEGVTLTDMGNGSYSLTMPSNRCALLIANP